jgi:hypothetical protein
MSAGRGHKKHRLRNMSLVPMESRIAHRKVADSKPCSECSQPVWQHPRCRDCGRFVWCTQQERSAPMPLHHRCFP